ncbi:hypothetical protein EM20IM_04785 [Candidatus Methylacidiphilum infernorum]|uniref:Uncharacterized protein n=1 Tax=Candidatus Methylacidiphilum infernorum TaxID=511746 RepID=A0ABX7PYB7_9BACT|nr:hypothetical protein [Candidatus Methylacidiphilum infernorum]QSR87638.1 hypothetical protein EM20IM_04785 [Candidatus Methylacidiphilum infernorum]
MNYPTTFETVSYPRVKTRVGIVALIRLFCLVYCWIAVPALLAYFYEILSRAGADHLFILKRVVERNFLLLAADGLFIGLSSLILFKTRKLGQKEEHELLPFWGMLWIGYLVARLSTPGHVPLSPWMGIYALFFGLIVVVLKKGLGVMEKKEVKKKR